MTYDAIIIGTGQAGPSLANRLTKAGMQVAIIERKRFGGTCVNNGCTPTKALVANAKVAQMIRQAEQYGILVEGFQIDMKKVKSRKDAIVKHSSDSVRTWLFDMQGCTVFEGHATFEGPHHVQVDNMVIEGKRIFINVGGRAHIPSISGLEEIPYWTNSTIMEVDFIPNHLLILGGGYIALEFAQIFRRFGSRVTIFQRREHLMPKEDQDISDAIREILEKEGIRVVTEATNLSIVSDSKTNAIHLQMVEGKLIKEYRGSHLLLATGRIPNTSDLGLEKAGVEVDKKGFIKVDDRLQTSQPHIWALGDCNGRGAFTHTSYNDYEIVASNLLNKEERLVSERLPIYALFIDPPLGRVGMTEREVRASGKEALMAKIPMSQVARAREKGETHGFMKILVEAKTQKILGASLLGVDCDEVIQTIADVMYTQAPYTSIQRGVHIHPTVTELLPTLLEGLKPI